MTRADHEPLPTPPEDAPRAATPSAPQPELDPAVTALARASLLLGALSLLVVPASGVGAIVIASRGAAGAGSPRLLWLVWGGSLIAPTAAVVLGSATSRGRREPLARAGVAMGALVIVLAAAASGVAAHLSRAPASTSAPPAAPTPAPAAPSPAPAASGLVPASPSPGPGVTRRRPGGAVALEWRPSTPEAPRVAVTPAASPLALVEGEPDPDWAPAPKGDGVVFGAPSKTWRATDAVVPDPDPVRTLDDAASSACFLRSIAVVVSSDPRVLSVYRAGRESSPERIQLGADVSSLVAAGSSLLCAHAKSSLVTVVDLDTGRIRRELPLGHQWRPALAGFPENPRVALALEDGQLVVIDVGRTQIVRTIPTPIPSLGESPHAFSIGGDGRFVYADIPMGSCLTVFDAWRGFEVATTQTVPGVPGGTGSDWSRRWSQGDRGGRFAFTSGGVFRAGLAASVSQKRYWLLGSMTDGSLLVVEPKAVRARPKLHALDPETATPRKTYEVDYGSRSPSEGGDRFALIPGTNRVVFRHKTSLVYRDLEPATGSTAAAGPRARFRAPPPSEAFVGEPWTLALDLEGARVTSVEVMGPSGMIDDPAAKCVTWTPRATQLGYQPVTITVGVEGAEPLVYTARVRVSYRELTVLGRWGALGAVPSGRWVVWLEDASKVVFLDPSSFERREVACAGIVDLPVELGEHLYLVGGGGTTLLELDAASLARRRECSLSLREALSVSAGADGTLSVVVREGPKGALRVVRVDPASGTLESRPVPDRVWAYGGSGYAYLHRVPPGERVHWLDASRFALFDEAVAPSSEPEETKARLYRWAESGEVEAAGQFPERPLEVSRGEPGFVLGRSGVHALDGTLVLPTRADVVTASGDGHYLAAIERGKDGAHPSATVSFYALPGLALLGTTRYELPRGSGFEILPITDAFLLTPSNRLAVLVGEGGTCRLVFWPIDRR